MSTRQKLHLAGGIIIETARDFNGRYWTGYANGCSLFFRDPAELCKFLKLPSGTRRDSLNSWLESLLDFDSTPKSS